MATKQQLEIEGTERNYPPAIKAKLKKTQAARETKAEAHVEFKKQEAGLLELMEKEGIPEVVDDSTVPPYILKITTKKSLKKGPWKLPKAKPPEDEDGETKH